MSIQTVRPRCFLAALVLLGTVATYATAADYQFVNIADSAGPFTGSFSVPAINNSGTVAFKAFHDAGGEGIFVGSGGAVTTLYDSSGPFGELGFSDINDNGTISFSATLDAGGSGIFTGNGGPTTTIAPGTGGNVINIHGTVAFGTGQAVFVGNGGPITTIADTSGPFSGNLRATSINDSGTVGFTAFLDNSAGEGIFTSSGGPITTVALAGPGHPFALVQDVQLNNAGRVVFQADLHEGDGGGQAIFLGSPGSLSMVADTSGPFITIGPAIGLNNNDQVAFKARLDAGGEGIFIGPDPLADKVIQIGDPLFGSTVTFLLFAKALNDNGEIAFRYDLANGIVGIAVARPEQPLAGDYNGDGSVDAADYVVWRKNDGTQEEYNAWRANFGRTAAVGAASGSTELAEVRVAPSPPRLGGPTAAVPEPCTLMLALVGLGIWKRLRVNHRPKK